MHFDRLEVNFFEQRDLQDYIWSVRADVQIPGHDFGRPRSEGEQMRLMKARADLEGRVGKGREAWKPVPATNSAARLSGTGLGNLLTPKGAGRLYSCPAVTERKGYVGSQNRDVQACLQGAPGGIRPRGSGSRGGETARPPACGRPGRIAEKIRPQRASRAAASSANPSPPLALVTQAGAASSSSPKSMTLATPTELGK